MRLRDLLESRSAPLYHWMTRDKAEYCFKHDEMPGRWEHYLPVEGDDYSGNSLSRNKRLHLYGDYRVTLDQAKLAARYKIIPVDGEYVFHGNPKRFPWRDATGVKRFSPPGDHIRSRKNYYDADLAEEFVIGDIKQLHKYLIEVVCHDHQVPSWIDDYCKKFSISLVED